MNHQHGFGEGTETTNHIESFWSEFRKLADFNKGFNTNNMDIIADRARVAIWKWRNKNSEDIRTDLALVLSVMHIPLHDI